MTVRFHPDAAAELDAAAVWYETEQAGLGQAFISEVSKGIAAIEEAPTSWPTARNQRAIRRFLLARFPFAILFRANALGVLVLAVAHTRRRPFYWRARRLP